MKVLSAILIGVLLVSLIVEHSEASGKRTCGGKGQAACKSTRPPRRGDAVQERDQVTFQDAMNYLREIEENW